MKYIFFVLALVLFSYSDVEKNCIYGGFVFLILAILLSGIEVKEPKNKHKG
jgi:hypothetical protein